MNELLSVIFLAIASVLFPKNPINEPKPTPTVVQIVQKAPAKTYPISNYSSRLRIRSFGQHFGQGDPKPNMACGKAFVGFHTGDDLEVFAPELTAEVPIKAVASGKILLADWVKGYGGLLVQASEIDGEKVTIYYGHLNLGSINKGVGDELHQGENFANLGKGCSSETDGERKHLHFAIKKGSIVDVRGYVQTKEALSSWLNPVDGIKKLSSS